ncbi:lyase [Streptomonospora alba]|uniref:Lyase n=1 Tax=Streptomonospora alba TaxID=183763 RepID=A0A0C2FFJ9_9ACTN|nr:VOC family protein [Streptomonospora alba]KIH98009.1 lyase [Streptomonospora alba]
MKLELRYCNITVTDVDESLAFYPDTLGLEQRSDVGAGVNRWATPGSATRPGLEYVLSVPRAGRSEADGDALQELLTQGLLPQVVFSTDDVGAAFERVKSSGAEVLQEPVDRPWGVRDSAFRDPSGKTVRIQQTTGA